MTATVVQFREAPRPMVQPVELGFPTFQTPSWWIIAAATTPMLVAEPKDTYGITERPGARKKRARHLAAVGATFIAGHKGTTRLVKRFGAQLLCVRYRYDAKRKVRQTTVELVVSERRWRPLAERIARDEIVGIALRREESDIADRVRHAGGWWNPVTKQWRLRLDKALKLGLASRVRRRRDPKARVSAHHPSPFLQ